MNKRNWKSVVGAFSVVALLFLVINPELRALLLLADLLGIEAVLLLLGTQLRANWPVIAGYAVAAAQAFGRTANQALYFTHWFAQGLLPREGLWLTADAAGLMGLNGLTTVARRVARR
jgi:hypothetical protein